mmetsp:Transcript_15226/g.48748  ORF Transcript_15226/g.48748 Transcript_15226/m.48748 type:complete len:90 (+) Transcript_15226:84-353(+)
MPSAAKLDATWRSHEGSGHGAFPRPVLQRSLSRLSSLSKPRAFVAPDGRPPTVAKGATDAECMPLLSDRESDGVGGHSGGLVHGLRASS